MKYDFDTIIDRKNTNSVKHDFYPEDVIPFWVADMDFKTADPIIKAMEDRVKHGVFGYSEVPEELPNAFINWQKKRNGYTINKNLLSYGYGVIPMINYLINKFTDPGDGILIQSPVYNHFFISIESWKRKPVLSKLWQDNDGRYFIDYDDFEAKIKSNNIKIFLLCNPQNPVGRVWTREELLKIGEICVRNGVIIVSDEIHSDLILKGKHVVMSSVSEEIKQNTITLFSATKTFNLAGIQFAFIEFNNENIFNSYNNYWNKMDLTPSNPITIAAMKAAYEEGEEWLSELLEYIRGNAELVKSFISENMSRIKTYELEATYLLWIDCRGLFSTVEELDDFFVKKAKIGLSSGHAYGSGGEGFMRWNLACSRKLIQEGLERLKKAYDELDFE